jgi:uncharacterized metal-binding protein
MKLPLVYSCSGCSSAAQLANHLAVRLDREGSAEMSCIAGLGGDVKSVVRKAHEAVDGGRPIVAIDGCVLACVKNTLARHGIAPSRHVELWRLGVRKHPHADFDPAQATELLAQCRAIVAELSAQAPVAASGCGVSARAASTARSDRASHGAAARTLG